MKKTAKELYEMWFKTGAPRKPYSVIIMRYDDECMVTGLDTSDTPGRMNIRESAYDDWVEDEELLPKETDELDVYLKVDPKLLMSMRKFVIGSATWREEVIEIKRQCSVLLEGLE